MRSVIASGPPNVPKSCITPSCQRKACICAPKPKIEKGSGIVFVDHPATVPRSSIPLHALSYPPKVPRGITCPSFHTTASTAGKPVSGSIVPLVESPATTPAVFTHEGLLLLIPGRAPKSLSTPCCHLNAC